VREAANRMSCSNNLKQLALACVNYESTYNGLPPARVARDAYATWPVLVMPFMEQDNAYKLWNITQGFSSQSLAAREVQVKSFFCPSRRQAPQISPGSQNKGPNNGLPGACGDYACCAGDGLNKNTYLANGAMICGHVTNPAGPGPQPGVNGIDQPNTNPPAQPLIPILGFTSYTNLPAIIDGTSNTFLIGEKHIRQGHFGQSGDGDSAYFSGASYDTAQREAGHNGNYRLARNPFDGGSNHRDRFGSWHPGICMFAFCDGSVHAINVNIDLRNLARLANRADGLVITATIP
jgi:hypothetical protein